ncbi:PREDICTED: connectin [Drosophila arizonae]|uniref:Connectin n=1 Tax=Drosophila arizonae TaxID=7263 RepID=A0ABM1P9V4_DROAR|nr:PREDICTED: connectin [Drosophila arizonae]XP_017863991.1 PREDICTED: connectin [Drosophila arizonae]
MLPHHHQRHRMWKLLGLLLLLSSCLVAPAGARSRDKEERRSNRGRNSNMGASASASAVTGNNNGGYYTSSSAYGSSSGSSALTGITGYNGPIDTTGFCMRRRDMKLMCYCTPDENHIPVQKAECWVFSEGLHQNDTTWTRFYQQKRLRELKFVIQNNARLDYIPTMIIEPLKNLSSIVIEYSQVEIVKSYAFANLPFLERIILNNNHIMALDQDAFANHIRLRELNLEHNQIFEMDRYAFRNLPLCERLFLNNNNISTLHEGLFADMARLTYLNLAYNQINVLTSEIFRGLGNLNLLKLTHNNLNFIGDTVFAELWSLTELELDDNRIERISERALDGLNNLKTLNLRNNLLKKIDTGLLRGTPALLSINVQANKLETLTFYTFQPIMDNLVNSTSELLVSDNKFICDCRLQWIFELRNRTRHQQLRDSLENFICALQEPKLSHFVDPVPSHILDLLNFGGFTAIGSNSASMGGIGGIGGIGSSSNYANLEELSSSNGLTMKKHSSSKSRQALRGQRQFTDNAENVVESKLRVRRKRQQQPEAEVGGVAAVAQTQKRYDYYDDTNGNAHASSLGLTHGLDMDDNLNLHKQSSFYGATGLAHNDVELQHQLQPQAGDALDTMANKNSLNVHLFMLKPDMLPCHDELSDPTELPLSRDLMDVRSNAGQDLLINGANPMQLTLGLLLSSLTLMLLLSQG